MARPKPTVIGTLKQDDGTIWNLLEAPALYVLTYQGEPFNLVTENLLSTTTRKYKKITYASEGSARYRVMELNRLFGTTEFAYIKIGVEK